MKKGLVSVVAALAIASCSALDTGEDIAAEVRSRLEAGAAATETLAANPTGGAMRPPAGSVSGAINWAPKPIAGKQKSETPRIAALANSNSAPTRSSSGSTETRTTLV